MSHPEFSAATREEFGSKTSVRQRAAGQVPVSINNSGEPSTHVCVDTKSAEALAGMVAQVATFVVDGEKQDVLVKSVDVHPTTDEVRHLDVLAVTDDKVVKVDVPVVPDTRECPGIKAGGLLEQMGRRIQIQCQAGIIPDRLVVDLSGVGIAQTVYASAIALPDGATLLTPPRTPLMTIIKTRGMRRAEATAETGEEA